MNRSQQSQGPHQPKSESARGLGFCTLLAVLLTVTMGGCAGYRSGVCSAVTPYQAPQCSCPQPTASDVHGRTDDPESLETRATDRLTSPSDLPLSFEPLSVAPGLPTLEQSAASDAVIRVAVKPAAIDTRVSSSLRTISRSP